VRLALLAILVALVVALLPGSTAATARPGPCAPWKVKTLIEDQGWLENLAFDGRGGITISALAQNRLLRLSSKGRLSTLLRDVHAPGGQVRRGRFLYFNTGNTVPLLPNGTIDRLDLKTGKRISWAKGLTMPNGLVFLPNGDAVASRDIGTGTGLTRVRAKDRKHPQFNWARLADTNGMAVDPSGRWLYVARTGSPDGEISRVEIAHPRNVRVAGRLGAGVLPDDLTADGRGVLYVAGFASGAIHRLDPKTHRSCKIATGIANPTSVRFGGRGWNPDALYATDAAGHLSVLRPPRR
jgi:sugar lactone lactonase YvrE